MDTTTYKGIVTAAAIIGLLGGAYYYNNQPAGQKDNFYNSTGDATSTIKVSQDNSNGSAGSPQEASAKINMDNSKNPQLTIKTNFGDIVVELFEKDAPKTVANFQKLSKEGFYDNSKFHRVIPNFMIQGGDPNSKDDDWSNDGMGGPGYQFADELNPSAESFQRGYLRGTLAMANSGPNTNGSQFFIMHQDYPLPNAYTIFGRVLSGLEVVDKIVSLPRNGNDHPTKDAIILSVK